MVTRCETTPSLNQVVDAVPSSVFLFAVVHVDKARLVVCKKRIPKRLQLH
jgi:hypothetical protein